jgi:hypothetical protein
MTVQTTSQQDMLAREVAELRRKLDTVIATLDAGDAAGPWHSRAGDSPAALADLFRQAGKLIEAEGYSPCADGIFVYNRRPGHSVTTALDAAAAFACEDRPADAADLAEDAHARLAGFLHLTGQRTRRTSIHDLCDEVAAWEDCRPGAGYRTLAEVLAVLDGAARLLDVLGGAR